MRSLFFTIVLALASIADALANCSNDDLGRIRAGMAFCRDSCGTSGHQQECNGWGKMGRCAPNDVLNGYTDCHAGQTDETNRMHACFNERQQDVMSVAHDLRGCGASPNPPPPPPPTTNNIDFNQPMTPANDNKQIIIADFVLPGQGEYRSITLNFHRDNVNLFSISTYAVNFDQAGGLHVKITTYDKSVPDVSKHKYTVAGTLTVQVSP
jgi:hypothetical protein